MDIIEAILIADLKLLKEAIAKGADVNEADGRYKRSSLHLAAINDNYDIAKALILAGADVNIKDRFEQTPLHFSFKNMNFKLSQLLLENGATPFPTDKQNQNVVEIEFIKNSLLHYELGNKIEKFKTTNEAKLGTLEVDVINTILENTFGKILESGGELNKLSTPINQGIKTPKANRNRISRKSKKPLSLTLPH